MSRVTEWALAVGFILVTLTVCLTILTPLAARIAWGPDASPFPEPLVAGLLELVKALGVSLMTLMVQALGRRIGGATP